LDSFFFQNNFFSFAYLYKFLFINSKKVEFFNEHYEEKYKGDGVLFDINDYVYIFNSNENKTIDSEQTVSYTLKDSGKKINTKFVAHTYAIINEDENKIEIDMCNLRLNADLIMSGQENEDQFMRAYAAGERMDNPKDFRTSVIELSGFETEPTVTATGSNGAKMSTKWSSDGTLTLTIISNGEVRITVE